MNLPSNRSRRNQVWSTTDPPARTPAAASSRAVGSIRQNADPRRPRRSTPTATKKAKGFSKSEKSYGNPSLTKEWPGKEIPCGPSKRSAPKRVTDPEQDQVRALRDPVGRETARAPGPMGQARKQTPSRIGLANRDLEHQVVQETTGVVRPVLDELDVRNSPGVRSPLPNCNRSSQSVPPGKIIPEIPHAQKKIRLSVGSLVSSAFQDQDRIQLPFKSKPSPQEREGRESMLQ